MTGACLPARRCDGGLLQIRTYHGGDVASIAIPHTFCKVCMGLVQVISEIETWQRTVSCTYSPGRAEWHEALTDSAIWHHYLCHQCHACVCAIKRSWAEPVGLIDCKTEQASLIYKSLLIFEDNCILQIFQTNYKKNQGAKELILI